ncbi:MAG: hypothetical protein ABL901_16950 [Hyphomicrobiaceae bacterium]
MISGFFERMSIARAIFLGLFALIVLAMAVLWYAFEGTRYEARFRLTVEIETSSGTKSAANVYRYTETPRFYPGGMISHIQGDAVFVDLGDGKTFIAYRGTDQVLPSWQNHTLGDVVKGWTGATGVGTTQAKLAVEFYKSALSGQSLQDANARTAANARKNEAL